MTTQLPAHDVNGTTNTHPSTEVSHIMSTDVPSPAQEADQAQSIPMGPLQASALTGQSQENPQSTTSDQEFIELPEGLLYIKNTDADHFQTIRVCSPIRVTALTRDEDGNSWGKAVEVTDPEGNTHEILLSAQHYVKPKGKYLETLSLSGLELDSSSTYALLHRYICTARGHGYMRTFSRFGWHGESTFVLPDAAYGLANDEKMFLYRGQSRYPFSTRGSLVEWQRNVGERCRGNSRLMFAVCLALGGPLLEPLELESGGFNLFGNSSTGKTTTLKVAGSVCGGGPNGYAYQWRATDNSLESIASRHNDSLLCLDEMGQAAPEMIAEVAYMLGNGQGKSRASRDGLNHSILAWRTILLSTGERPMALILNEGRGSRLRTGHMVRIVDVPADAGKGMGIFEELHGHESPASLANTLQAATSQYFGTPLRVFLKWLVDGRPQAVSRAHDVMECFRSRAQAGMLASPAQRICRRFELVAAAGDLASTWGVLPWSREENLAAVERCFHDWLESAAEHGNDAFGDEDRRLRKFLVENEARFVDLDNQSATSGMEDTSAGYYRTVEGQRLCLIKQEVLEKEIFSGRPAQRIYRALAARGISQVESPGKASSRKPTTQKGRMIALNTAALGLARPVAVTDPDQNS